MQRALKLCFGKVGALNVVAVGFVDDYAVGHLHDASFDALQLVAGACQLYQQEEVDHRMHSGLTLSHSNGLHKDVVEAGGLTKHDGFASLACHAAERACRRAGADEGFGMNRQFLHAGLVAEDTAFGALAARVDGENGELAAVFKHMQSELVDRRTLAGTRHSGDADAARVACRRKALFYHFLSQCLMLGHQTLHKRHRSAQHSHVALEDAFHIFASCHRAAALARMEVRVDFRWLCHSTVDSKSGKRFAVLRMAHHIVMLVMIKKFHIVVSFVIFVFYLFLLCLQCVSARCLAAGRW